MVGVGGYHPTMWRRVLSLLGVLVFLVCTGCSFRPLVLAPKAASLGGGEVQSQKPDLNAISPAMMVGRQSFPTDAVGDWKPPYMYEEYSGAGSDEGCGPIAAFWERGADSHALASLDATTIPHELRYRVDLILPKNRNHRDIAGVVDACHTFEFQGHSVRVERESVDGVPAWATAFKLELMSPGETQSWVMGQYRGIDIKVSATNAAGRPDPMPAVAKLFTDQVAKLEEQPY